MLSGANTYTGNTTINAGTLELSGGSAIVDTGTVNLANTAGALLKLNAAKPSAALPQAVRGRKCQPAEL